MMVFWIFAAGLVGVALLFVLTPLLRPTTPKSTVDAGSLNRTLFHQQLAELDADLASGNLDPARHAAARHDLERQLLYSLDETSVTPVRTQRRGRWAALMLGVTVPVAAIGLYRVLGNAEIIPQLQAPASGSEQARGDRGAMPPMEVLVQRLADKLAQDPNNLEGWLMLGRSYAATGQAERSLAAYRRAYTLAPREPEVLLSYAEALANQNDHQLAGEPERLIATVLEIAPQDPNGLWLAGVAGLQRGDRETALRYWEQLESLLPPEGEDIANLRGFLDQVRGESAPINPSPTSARADTAPRDGGAGEAAPHPEAGLQVEISLEESLRALTRPDQVLFVYARALDGPSMPLAVHRARVGDLPLSVTLDDRQAMTPESRLSKLAQVRVGARISLSGNASPRPGDLEGEAGPVAPGSAEPVRVHIDRVRPQ